MNHSKMKKLIFILPLFFLMASSALAQGFKIGPKVGVVSANTSLRENFDQVKAGEAVYGFQGGLFSRIELGALHIQPEILLTSTGSRVNLMEDSYNKVLNYEYSRLDVPVLVGLKLFNFLRIQGGIVTTMMLNADIKDYDADNFKSELINGYKKSTMGYQTGVGFDIGKMTFDLRYEGSLSKYSDTITIPATNEAFSTDHRSNQLIFSIGYSLI
jgi:hypothetical protein